MNKQVVIPRNEYPRPIFRRRNWLCLNGEWDFAYDYGRSGEDRGMVANGEYPLKITVPFCPESKLSGIRNTDFIPAVWYRKTVDFDKLPQSRVLLHFGAVDYYAKVWVNGIFVGEHKGGYAAFYLDVTDALCQGENTIVVYAEDDVRSGCQPYGKQSSQFKSSGCYYTRTTGIYQTVWLEFVPTRYLVNSKNTPHACDGYLDLQVKATNPLIGDFVRVKAYYKGKKVGEANAAFVGNIANARLRVDELHLWDVGKPEIYDLTIELADQDGQTIDSVDSYFAMRDVSFTNKSLTINGKPIFMRLILDQGFNPDGIYTAPNVEYLRQDILLAMQLGFNGARFHQRIFEPYSLYYADILGYIVWVEMPISSSHLENLDVMENYLPEWMDIVESHYNYPCVVGWVPLNETYHRMKMNTYSHKLFYTITKQMDCYRPVIDASGGVHYQTDMFDTHDYEQNPEIFKSHYQKMLEDENAFYSAAAIYRGRAPARDETYAGQAYWVSEYGGTFWDSLHKNGDGGWGCGYVKNEQEFATRYTELTDVMLSHPRICGFCYTQLTDIEQEQNGLYYYDRTEKFSKEIYEKVRQINLKQAEIEK